MIYVRKNPHEAVLVNVLGTKYLAIFVFSLQSESFCDDFYRQSRKSYQRDGSF